MTSADGKQPASLREAIDTLKGSFTAVAVFSFFLNLLLLTAPLYMLQVFDRVLTSRSGDTLVLLTLMAAIALLTMAALEIVRGQILVKVGVWLDRRLGPPVLAGSIQGALQNAADASTQGLRDLATFRTFMTGPSVFPVLDAPWMPVFLGVAFLLHPLLGWLCVFGALVLFGLAVLNEVITRAPMAQSSGASIAALHRSDAVVRNADTIEAMGMMDSLLARWKQENAQAIELQALASDRSGAVSALSKFLRMVLQIGVMGLGAYLVLQGEITPGTMIASSIIMGRALAPVDQAIGAWKQMTGAVQAYQRLKTPLAAVKPDEDAMAMPEPKGALVVDGLRFFHPGSSDATIRGISFQLAPGESLGLVGPSAGGKSTLARLLIGNAAPSGGHVRLDGIDMHKWSSRDRGPHVGYVAQDVEVFSATLRDNIARMGEGDSDAVIEAAKMAGIHDMILRFPDGYDTKIGYGGMVMTGGQRQRIALARAIYGSPKFLVLDEPNANLDGAGEVALIEAIKKLKERGVTMVVIAHRPGIVKHLDKMMVLRGGAIEKFGPSDEVLAHLQGAGTVAAPGGNATGRLQPTMTAVANATTPKGTT